jgi:hypothetical protein
VWARTETICGESKHSEVSTASCRNKEVRDNLRVRQSSLAEEWESEEPQRCDSLRSNVELVVRHSPATMDVNTEAEEATGLEAVTRQTLKTQCVL